MTLVNIRKYIRNNFHSEKKARTAFVAYIDPVFRVTVSNASACDDVGVQVCHLMVTEPNVTFNVSVSTSGNVPPYIVQWYKFYSGQSPQFNSYRRRLGDTLRVVMGHHGLALTLLSIKEDDFYPNLFWAEVRLHPSPDKPAKAEVYDLTVFEMLNPSSLRYYFVLDSRPIELGEFLEGDAVAIYLPQYLQLSPSSFVQWTKEPRPMAVLGSSPVVLVDATEGIEIGSLKEQDFGYIRALVYDFSPDLPGRVLVAQRLFLVKKDISKTCVGNRNAANCYCKPGFEGNGVHCVDVDECADGTSCLPEAECVNIYGSYSCRCPEGFEGDGRVTCIDVDECIKGSHSCNRDAVCLNTLGSYDCMCQSGFVGDGIHCRAKSTWTPWSPWSVCSATCGFQNRIRIRRCTHPESGMRCVGPSADLKPCLDLPSCPVDGHWSEWSPWSMCTETCAGVKERIRTCDSPGPSGGGKPCQGEKVQFAMCESKPCPVDGGWSAWTSWTPCPVSCGLAIVSRTRQCNVPAPKHGGKTCSGHGYEEGSCGFPAAFCQYLTKPYESTISRKPVD
nr:PREDICTED: uncharacterized protein LOC103281800 [Anolis carolinensis]|eukprot:XP_008122217.2 PREDICTED: uncharacterized protein LOC103281800 [Anolis carolinensis]